MSVSRDTPLGTLTVASDPVEGGDVVDFPRSRDEAQADLDATLARHDASNAQWSDATAMLRQIPDPWERFCAIGAALDACAPPKPARALVLVPDTTGGAA